MLNVRRASPPPLRTKRTVPSWMRRRGRAREPASFFLSLFLFFFFSRMTRKKERSLAARFLLREPLVFTLHLAPRLARRMCYVQIRSPSLFSHLLLPTVPTPSSLARAPRKNGRDVSYTYGAFRSSKAAGPLARPRAFATLSAAVCLASPIDTERGRSSSSSRPSGSMSFGTRMDERVEEVRGGKGRQMDRRMDGRV